MIIIIIGVAIIMLLLPFWCCPSHVALMACFHPIYDYMEVLTLSEFLFEVGVCVSLAVEVDAVANEEESAHAGSDPQRRLRHRKHPQTTIRPSTSFPTRLQLSLLNLLTKGTRRDAHREFYFKKTKLARMNESSLPLFLLHFKFKLSLKAEEAAMETISTTITMYLYCLQDEEGSTTQDLPMPQQHKNILIHCKLFETKNDSHFSRIEAGLL